MPREDEGDHSVIYLDNAATSWPKPPQVVEAMVRFQETAGANPGRSGHRMAVEAGRMLYDARESIASLFNTPDPLRVVFTGNATEAINLALRGLLRPGDHVITGSMEHNSMMRPLRDLAAGGVELSVVPCRRDGSLDIDSLEGEIRGETRMLAINHASNVTGTLAPVASLGRLARERGLLLLLDTAQTGGCYPIDVQADRIDLLAFTGHKGLMGPQGTGGLVIGERIEPRDITPLKTGGTGSRSEHEHQPGFLPDLCESGTPNTIGIAGLGAGVRFVLRKGVERIREREMELTRRLLRGLAGITPVSVYGTTDVERCTATVSFNIGGMAPSEVGMILDEDFDIMCRVGLHCAPSAHRTTGTFPDGTVRLGIGYFNTAEDIDDTLEAVSEIAAQA
jgi:cysteine desulfurase / selenocysteine lyase